MRAPSLVMALLLAMLMAAPAASWAHPGKLDEFGGHFDEKTGLYHYHRPKAEMARRKREFLTWQEVGRTGELHGEVVKIERPDAIWVRIPYRPAFEEMAKVLTPPNRDNKDQLVLVWFLHVSPEASAARGKAYNAWFHKKVMYELDRKLKGQEVVVQFKLVQHGKRLWGMVLLGEENINLWLVLNGWSYYLLRQEPNLFDKQFTRAEDIARKSGSGLWQKAK